MLPPWNKECRWGDSNVEVQPAAKGSLLARVNNLVVQLAAMGKWQSTLPVRVVDECRKR